MRHREWCAYWNEPPSLRDHRDCNCGEMAKATGAQLVRRDEVQQMVDAATAVAIETRTNYIIRLLNGAGWWQAANTVKEACRDQN